jgi:hypothetical protein
MGDTLEAHKKSIISTLNEKSAKEKIKETFKGKVFHKKEEKSKTKCVNPDKNILASLNKGEDLYKW